MDDVDRLFQCFKCGITPPESAMRERKRSRSKLKQGIPEQSEIASPISVARDRKEAAASSSSSSSSSEKSVQKKPEAPRFCSEKKFSPVVFYGSPNGVPPKRPSRLFLRLLQEIREDCAEQRKSSLSKKIWSTFPRQEEAMKLSKGHENTRVFSYQDHVTGLRRFLVSTYTEFWERYKNMESKFRHHYEVIQEDLPCHLYFDLEFNTKENAGKDGDEMVDLLISIIFEALLDKYTIQGHREWILELDSSTDAKFSRHLIIRVPKTAFKDNLHAGAFVNEICSRILSRKEENKLLEKLFIRKEAASTDSDSHIFVDTAVYTRNRCFRLAFSSKAGKTSVLLPSGRYNAKDMRDEDLFMRSLICNMDADCEKLLICKTDALCMKTLQFDTEVNNYGPRRCYDWPQELRLKDRKIESSTACLMGKSPFPDLDGFIESVATIGNVSGKISSWILFPEDGLMVYSMLRNRYCERIGRQHKSNHVMYVVDLRRADYYQKCHDPDCRGYRSPLRPIPWEFVPETVLSECCNDDARNAFDSSTPDSWWLEAARFADKVEKKQDLSQLSMMGDIDDVEDVDEDENWWLAAEKTASLAGT